VETQFADFKELMGSDQYQLHSAEAIVRFWALRLCLCQYLDSLRHRLKRVHQREFTLGVALHWVRERKSGIGLDLPSSGLWYHRPTNPAPSRTHTGLIC